jgi:hypothetical protein
LAEWIYEAGIGEARAALIEDGAILEAAIEPDDEVARTGTVLTARLEAVIPAGGVMTTDRAGELLLSPLPAGLSIGATTLVEITRSAIAERGRAKRALARPADSGAKPALGPDLLARIQASGTPVRHLQAYEPDLLEAAGWSELLDEATRGEITFPGGSLRLSLTPAMALFDVDGALAPDELAIAGAVAAGRAIRRMGIGGSIGIDLPTAPERAARLAAAAALDAVLPPPFERTAINGFGFLQLIRRRSRASLPELIAADPTAAEARALLRRIERSQPPHPRDWPASPQLLAIFARRRDWLAEAERRVGRPIALVPAGAIGDNKS